MTKRDATWWQRLLLPLCAVLFLTAAAEDETRRKTLSVAVFEELQAAQERLDAGDTAGAVRRLEQLATRVADDGFSFGVVQQYAVNAYLQAEQPERARAIAEQALARTDLSADARQQLTYLAGRLALVADDFPVAIERLETWLAAETRPVGEVFYLLGYACYRMERFADAEGHLRNAVALGPATDGWYELLLAVLLEQKKHDAAAELLVERIGADPARAEQWKRLSSLYFTTGQDTEGLAVLRLARGLGLIEDDAELERLLRMHRHVGVPERAARLLSGWLADGGLQPNPERLMTLAELWLEARERDAAKTALAKAADVASDGRAADLLGRLEFEDENWQAAATAFQKARARGGADDNEQSALLLGIAALHSGQAELARRSLEEAAAQPATARQALYWLRSL